MTTNDVSLLYPGRHELGEGALWHDGLQRLFWFSILEGRLLSCDARGGDAREWLLGERASAAGIIDDRALLIATETGLWRLDLETGEKSLVAAVEADNPLTRSNDGRAAPDGSFWFGTMGLRAEREAGAIYRYSANEGLDVIARRITIPNAICFSPDGRTAYFADTTDRRVMRLALDETGSPNGSPEVLIDLREEGLNPDGAVTDAEGCIWIAQWGASRVARYAPGGALVGEVRFPCAQVSCPAFGGADLSTLFVTTAWEHMPEAAREAEAGSVFAVPVDVRGVSAARVRMTAS